MKRITVTLLAFSICVNVYAAGREGFGDLPPERDAIRRGVPDLLPHQTLDFILNHVRELNGVPPKPPISEAEAKEIMTFLSEPVKPGKRVIAPIAPLLRESESTAKVASGEPNAGAGSIDDCKPTAISSSLPEEGVHLGIDRANKRICIPPKELEKLGIAPDELSRSLEKVRKEGISLEDRRTMTKAILSMSDVEVERMGLTKQKVILELKMHQQFEDIKAMLALEDEELMHKSITREALGFQLDDIAQVYNGFSNGRLVLPSHGTPFATSFFHDYQAVLKDMEDRGIGLYGRKKDVPAISSLPPHHVATPPDPTKMTAKTVTHDTLVPKPIKATDPFAENLRKGLQKDSQAKRNAKGEMVHVTPESSAATLSLSTTNSVPASTEIFSSKIIRDKIFRDLEASSVSVGLDPSLIRSTSERMDKVIERATRSDGSTDVHILAEGYKSIGIDTNVTPHGKIDIAFPGMPSAADRRPPDDNFYTLLPNGDRIDSEGTLYKAVKSREDKVKMMTNGGRLSPCGTEYYVDSSFTTRGIAPEGAGASYTLPHKNHLEFSSKDKRNVLSSEAVYRSSFTPLIKAVLDSNPDEVNRLLVEGANPNEKDREGETALLKSIRSSNLALMEILLAHKANPNFLSHANRTPMIYVMSMKGAELRFNGAKLLLDHEGSASVNQVTDYGTTALIQAILQKDERTVALLLDHGADSTLGRISTIGSIDGISTLEHAIVERLNIIANALVSNLLSKYPSTLLPIEAGDLFERAPDKKFTTLLHVLAQGGENYVENILNILRSPSGLKALSIKDSDNNLPEQIVRDVGLKDHMKSLREGYKSFQENMKMDVFWNISTLRQLSSIATHIRNHPGNFLPIEVQKANKIISGLEFNEKVGEVNTDIMPLEGIADELSRLVGELAVTPPKDKKRIGDLKKRIQSLCKDLKEGYAKVKELDSSIAFLRAKLDNHLRILRDKKNTDVTMAIDSLMPASFKTDKLTMEKAATYTATAEPKFDPEMADIDMETLQALLAASKSDQKAIQIHLDARIAEAKSKASDKGEVSAKALKRFIEKIRYILEHKKTDLDGDVAKALEASLKRGVPNQFIWNVLHFAQDEKLQRTYTIINKLELSDKDTVVSGSVAGSILLAGSKLRAHDMDNTGSTYDGSTIGGYGRLGEVDEVDEADTELATNDSYKLPTNLKRDHINTLFKLYTHDYVNIPESGHTIGALFNSLPGFTVRDEGGKMIISHVRGHTIGTHAKHNKDYRGLNPAFGADCVSILKTLGIEERDLEEARELDIRVRGSGAAVSLTGGGSEGPAASGAGIAVRP